MKKNNAFLAKQDATKQKCFEVGYDTAMQQFFDLLCLVLNNPEIMGKDVFGKDRLLKIHKALLDYEKEYRFAYLKHQEADYYQEKLDAQLRSIFDGIDPFKVRYPFMKEWNYNKPLKE